MSDGTGPVADPTAEDRLAKYRRMRDFARTPEPSGGEGTVEPSDGPPRFAIQQHDATRLHWDLRLEHEGVLWSWAMPRGVPWSPDENRLAVHTEDHPLEYLVFEGDIPDGSYGAGHMVVWDRGTYEAEELEERKVVITLHGERVEGRFALFATRGRDWMIHRMTPPQDPDRRPLPSGLRPQQGEPGDLPDGEDWALEICWTGERALLSNDAGRVTITDAVGADIGQVFPEVRRIGRALAAVEAVLDGVIVAVDRDGRPKTDRAAVDRRLALTSDSGARRAAERSPTAFLAVDLLWLEGHPTTHLTYDERRTLLEELGLEGPAWQTPGSHTGNGAALLDAARAQGLAGLVAKRRASTYRPGETTDDWLVVT